MKYAIINSSDLGDNWLPEAHIPEVWRDRLLDEIASYEKAIAGKQAKINILRIELRKVDEIIRTKKEI